jgi:nitrogen regulatory protein PII 2
MKTIMAIIRIDKINETKRALSDIGMPSFMATGRVYGRGKGKYDAEVLEGVKNEQPEAISIMGPEPRLRPQRLITITVKDDQVKQAVDALIEANSTNSPGDGKIFVTPCSDAIQIRTGIAGEAVI